MFLREETKEEEGLCIWEHLGHVLLKESKVNMGWCP